MKTLVHLPLRVHPKMKERIAAMAELEGMSSSEYTRFLLKTGLDGRAALVRSSTTETERSHETR